MSETNQDSFAHCGLPAGNFHDRLQVPPIVLNCQKIAFGGVGLSITLLSSVYMQGRNLSRHVRQITLRDQREAVSKEVAKLSVEIRSKVPSRPEPENPWGLGGVEAPR